MALIFLLAIDQRRRSYSFGLVRLCPAKLIQIELFRGGCVKALGVQIGVSQELEKRAVENRWFPTCWSLEQSVPRVCHTPRRVVIGKDLELLNGVDRRQKSRSRRPSTHCCRCRPAASLCCSRGNRPPIEKKEPRAPHFAARAASKKSCLGFVSVVVQG